MDFSFSPEEEKFRMELRQWLEENLPEGWLEGKVTLPEDRFERTEFLRQWQRKLYEGGWAGISWPKEYGGRGATLIEEVIYEQEMARVKAPPVLNSIGIWMVGPTLLQIGTEEQRKKYVPKILSGEEIWCQGYSEPNAGSDLAAIQTRAERKNGRWVINGQKIWTSYAHVADRCFLLARTSNTGKKHEGITAFLVDMHQPGVETRPIHQMNDQYDFNEVFFNDAVAEDADIVGEVDDGWKVGLILLGHERVGIARWVFRLQGQFEELVEMTKRLEQGGQPLIKDPFVRQRLIDYYARTKAALYTYYRHLTKQLKTGHPGPEGSMDKLLSGALIQELLGYAVSLQGAYSSLWREDALVNPIWQNSYLRAFGHTIEGGTSEIQKNIVAERILGLPKDVKF
ncbi:MAG: acyl-CoA dehydrogenase [Bacillus thermozeamaize]|uniref:Acyl-CoA dehydrogenase n=1 Tax=Bacillus thermozeamaize TaxID=230954 RepID=A0A1Y3PB98_9BACI|nr:MAG: acyl-CoA dehydrogenase [Bacillus thermozeamaize]